jgi:hypothetical protein
MYHRIKIGLNHLSFFPGKGGDFDRLMKVIYDTIRDVYLQKEEGFIREVKKYKSKE